MIRYILFKKTNGNCVSHGTVLLSAQENIVITSHVLDDAYGAEYFVSLDGTAKNLLRAASKIPNTLFAKGSEVVDGPPYLYEIKFDKLESDEN